MSLTNLTGTIVPLVTPFGADGALNPEGMTQLIDYVIDQGADALMPTALTGEGPLLTSEEMRNVWEVVFAKVQGRLPVIPAIISITTENAIKLARSAESFGADALMVAPIIPELYAARSHDDVYGFYSDVASVTSLPIILFNYPTLTGVDFLPALVEKLVRIDNVRYIKESTGDSRRVQGLQRQIGERITVICGAPNFALESLALGCRLWLTGIMNIVPRSARQLMQAVISKGDLVLARSIYYQQILPFGDVMARNNNPTGTIKAGVFARGVDVGRPRRPGNMVTPEDLEFIRKLVEEVVREEEKVAQELEK
jgi:4-hydroxy-tetrahydrodipicolinate synthase